MDDALTWHEKHFCKNVLGNIIYEVPLIQQLLKRLQPTSTQVTSPAKKRLKLDELVHLLHDILGSTYLEEYRSSSSTSPSDLFPSLALLAEVLAAKALPGSLDLIARLLDTLNSVLHYESSSQGDKSYVEQLLMAAVENAANKVVVSP
jgi:U3 small nucleolar RNA-associated protein 10